MSRTGYVDLDHWLDHDGGPELDGPVLLTDEPSGDAIALDTRTGGRLMSYSRFSHADVYVYMDVNGSLACCGCLLTDDPEMSGGWYYDSTEEMIAHLDKHRAAGHDVPDYLDEALREDDEENFPPTCRDGHDWGEPFHPYADRGGDLLLRRLRRVTCTRCDWTSSIASADLPDTKESA